MCGLEMWRTYSKRDQMKTTYHDKITRLKRRLKEKDSERVQVIKTLRGQIEEVKATLIAEATLRSENRVMERVMEETAPL